MKLKILAIAIISSLLFSGCEDKLMEVADFSSSSKAPYVELTSKAVLAAKEGATASIAVRTREAFQKPITVNYTVTGAFTASGTGTIARNSTSGTLSVAIPANVVVAPATTADAIVTLTGATLDGKALSIGFLNATGEKRTIRVSK